MPEVIHVFVYGSLMFGKPLSGSLENSILVSNAVIEGCDLYSLGWFLGIKPASTDKRVKGELYRIAQETLNDLGSVEGYPHIYDRELVPVWLADSDWATTADTAEAWVCVYNGAVIGFLLSGNRGHSLSSEGIR